MLGCGLAGSFQQLLVWRWVTGLGSALQMSGSQLCLADISRADNRARCLGTNQVGLTRTTLMLLSVAILPDKKEALCCVSCAPVTAEA